MALLAFSVQTLLLPRRTLTVYWTDPPLLDTVAGILCRCIGRKYWVVIQDRYPEIVFRMNIIRSPLLRRLGNQLELFALRGASRVICISSDMQRQLEALGVANATTIENWPTGASETPASFLTEARSAAFGKTPDADRLIVKFAGNFGAALDLDLLEKAMPLLSQPERILLIFQGRGRKQERVEALAKKHANVRIEGWVPQHQVAHSLAACDMHLVTFPASLTGVAFPSKTYGIFQMGMPLLAATEPGTHLDVMIKRLGAGVSVNSSDPLAFARALDDLAKLRLTNPEAFARMGEAGRRFVTEEWREDLAVAAYRNLWDQTTSA